MNFNDLVMIHDNLHHLIVILIFVFQGWGGGYTGSSVLPVLQQVGRAHVELLDRWTVACRSLA